MGSIVSFANGPERSDDVESDSMTLHSVLHDEFLLKEGLEMLASFRSIADRAARTKVRALVDQILAEQKSVA